VHSGGVIQLAVDELARTGRGGVIQLDRDGFYFEVSVTIPWTPSLDYAGIKIRGDRSTLYSAENQRSPLIWIGAGWDDWDGKKLEGIELSGLIVRQQSTASPNCKGVFIEFTTGAQIRDCEFVDCPLEALYEGGGTSNERLQVDHCRARGCGHGWAPGPLAAFNLNGLLSTLSNSSADDCGWGLESGGTELRVSGCRFTDAPLISVPASTDAPIR
jgi:hypothetical protein